MYTCIYIYIYVCQAHPRDDVRIMCGIHAVKMSRGHAVKISSVIMSAPSIIILGVT